MTRKVSCSDTPLRRIERASASAAYWPCRARVRVRVNHSL